MHASPLRRVWIVAAAVTIGITAALVIRNQLRVAAGREVRRVQAERNAVKRFGEAHDGGYPLCANLLAAVQAGYSYGISGYDGWGCDVSRQLHVPLHQYDCFDLREPSCPGGRTVFHAECVGTKIDQLDVEFHHVDDPKYVETLRRLKRFFYIAHVHFNNFSCDPALQPFPSWAFEVLLVNKRIAMTDGTPAPAASSGIDAANDASAPDCQARQGVS